MILILALLIMGPKRIPELASNLGKAIRSFRRATRELRDQIDLDEEVRRPLEDLRSALRDEPPPPRSPSYHLMTPAVPAMPVEPPPPAEAGEAAARADDAPAQIPPAGAAEAAPSTKEPEPRQ